MFGVTLLDVCLVVITPSSGLWISFYRNKTNQPHGINISEPWIIFLSYIESLCPCLRQIMKPSRQFSPVLVSDDVTTLTMNYFLALLTLNNH